MKKRSVIAAVAGGVVALAVAAVAVGFATDWFGTDDRNQVAVDGDTPLAELDPPGRSGAAFASDTPTPGDGPGAIPTGCLVPDVRGKPLSVAVLALQIYGCKPGRVTQVRSTRLKKGYVIVQSSPPGRQLTEGAKVSLKVGRGPAR